MEGPAGQGGQRRDWVHCDEGRVPPALEGRVFQSSGLDIRKHGD